jgi:hypothetical protein
MGNWSSTPKRKKGEITDREENWYFFMIGKVSNHANRLVTQE